MGIKSKGQDYLRIDAAAGAHTRLNLFAAVQALLENGLIPSGSKSADSTARKIIKLCLAEQQRQLTLYDEHSGRDAYMQERKKLV